MAEGYDIVSARDGEEALTVAMKEKPDLIISDVMMPKISGFDMLDILRTTEETKNAKVIMMTALSQAEDKARAEKLGADRYLVKSQVTLEDVAKVAKQVLDGEAAPASETPAAQPAAEPAPAAPAAPAPPAPAANPAPVAEPTAQAPATETPSPTPTPVATPLPANDAPADDTPAAAPAQDATAASDESTKKKVIQPINDLKEDPERKLKDLLEKEKQREEMAKTVQETVQKSQPEVPTGPEADAPTPETPVKPPAPEADAPADPNKPDPNSIAL